jgi:SAM-dependent methyltransferase
MSDYRIQDGHYVLGESPTEYPRLAGQADVWATATYRILERAGLRAGIHVLDVGCGTGAVMRMLADIIGPTGRVTGIDRNAALGSATLARLQSEGPEVFSFIEADVTKIDAIEGAPFDLVFARLLLAHLADPVAVLRRFWRWVKPGGTLVIMDYDMLPLRSVPTQPTAERAIQLLRQFFVAAGMDVETGTRMPTLFAKADIGLPDACEVAGLIVPAKLGLGQIRGILHAVRESSIKLGVASARLIDALDADLLFLEDSREFLIRTADLTGTIKRKPL